MSTFENDYNALRAMLGEMTCFWYAEPTPTTENPELLKTYMRTKAANWRSLRTRAIELLREVKPVHSTTSAQLREVKPVHSTTSAQLLDELSRNYHLGDGPSVADSVYAKLQELTEERQQTHEALGKVADHRNKLAFDLAAAREEIKDLKHAVAKAKNGWADALLERERYHSAVYNALGVMNIPRTGNITRAREILEEAIGEHQISLEVTFDSKTLTIRVFLRKNGRTIQLRPEVDYFLDPAGTVRLCKSLRELWMLHTEGGGTLGEDSP